MLRTTYIGLAIVLLASVANAAVTLPGDSNGDWQVNAADYVSLRKTNSSYAVWRANYGQTAATAGVVIGLGDDIQAKINASPANTLFYVKAGERRLTTGLIPKTGDTFVAEPGADLNGSRLLTSFTSSSGRWYATGQTQGAPSDSSQCQPAFSQCSHPEDVFIDDKPLLHVGSLGAVGPGKWYFDYSADRIYLGDNPNGHKVETSIASNAFSGTAPGVGIYGFTVEKFATPSQRSAIESGGLGWIVANNETRFNHAGGIQGSDYGIIRNNFSHDNGQQGITANGMNVTIDSNEISHNNWAGYDYEWEAGAGKFAQTTNLVLKNNFVHNNNGAGLWLDIDNVNALVENNTIQDNVLSGIQYEISYKATIRNNFLLRNAADWPAGEYGASDFHLQLVACRSLRQHIGAEYSPVRRNPNRAARQG